MLFGASANPDHDDTVRTIHRALPSGINVTDTADGYSHRESEQVIGQLLSGGWHDA